MTQFSACKWHHTSPRREENFKRVPQENIFEISCKNVEKLKLKCNYNKAVVSMCMQTIREICLSYKYNRFIIQNFVNN